MLIFYLCVCRHRPCAACKCVCCGILDHGNHHEFHYPPAPATQTPFLCQIITGFKNNLYSLNVFNNRNHNIKTLWHGHGHLNENGSGTFWKNVGVWVAGVHRHYIFCSTLRRSVRLVHPAVLGDNSRFPEKVTIYKWVHSVSAQRVSRCISSLFKSNLLERDDSIPTSEAPLDWKEKTKYCKQTNL